MGVLLLALVVGWGGGLGLGQPSSPSLDFATALQLARSGPDVALAQLALAQADAASRAMFPTASGTLRGGYSQRWTDAPGSATERSGLDPFSLDVTFDVVPYGPAFDARQGAERSVTRARLAVQDAIAQATIGAARSYLQALRAQQRVDVDAAALVQAQAALDHTAALRTAGDATDADVGNARVAVEQARTTQATDRLALLSALATLSDVLGRPVEAVGGEPPPTRDPTADDAAAGEGRSDVQAAALAVASSRQDLAGAVRQVLPTAQALATLQGGDGNTTWSAGARYDTISFQPSVQAGLTPGGSTFGSTTTTLSGTSFALSLSITVPLDTALGPGLERARLSVASARQTQDRTRQQADLAIGAARRTLQAGQLGLTLAAAQADLARDQADQARERFALGLIAQPTLDQANLAARQAELARASAEDSVLLGRLELAEALGLDPMEVF